jgi:hypothetical protein
MNLPRDRRSRSLLQRVENNLLLKAYQYCFLLEHLLLHQAKDSMVVSGYFKEVNKFISGLALN